jgi:hypothetical protein
MNEPELGAEINPGMALNPFPSSILDKTRQYLNPQPLDRELSPLTTRPDLHPLQQIVLILLKLSLLSTFYSKSRHLSKTAAEIN